VHVHQSTDAETLRQELCLTFEFLNRLRRIECGGMQELSPLWMPPVRCAPWSPDNAIAARIVGVAVVGNGIDIDLGRVENELVDQHRMHGGANSIRRGKR
jgi:hypothetical protein